MRYCFCKTRLLVLTFLVLPFSYALGNFDNLPFYAYWDNEIRADIDDLEEDPLLAIRTKIGHKEDPYDIIKSWEAFALLSEIAEETVDQPNFFDEDHFSEEFLEAPALIFDHCPIILPVTTSCSDFEKMWWQISADPEFRFLIPNFNQVQSSSESISLDLLNETFINPGQLYYFRSCIEQEAGWSAWSEPYGFIKYKPDRVSEALFEKIGEKEYQISWEAAPDPETRYFIFASNSRDFVPSIYYDNHPNAIQDSRVTSSSPNYNFLYATSSVKIKVDGSAAYFRIIAESGGSYSIPSPLIYIYDDELEQRPDVLKFDGMSAFTVRQPVRSIGFDLSQKFYSFLKNPHVPENVWKTMSPFFLPKHHPTRPKLEKIFKKNRITQTFKSIEEGGFNSSKPGPCSHTIVSRHRKIKGYILKFFADEQRGLVDWEKLRNRVLGARRAKEIIRKYGYEKFFKVPEKWIYPLPAEPSPRGNYERKNFLLIAQDMKIFRHRLNYQRWRSGAVTKNFLNAFYKILREGD